MCAHYISQDKPNILILGGSEMAYQLAQELQFLPVRVVSSLAGRTQNPRPPVGQWRRGGFGGIEGLVHFLQQNHINLMVDATHPFARTIQANASQASLISHVPLLRLQPPPWQKTLGDQWIDVASEHQAAAILPNQARVFLALGRQHLAPFASRKDVIFIARMLEKPANPYPFHHIKIILAPPSTQDEEIFLFREYNIDLLVCRNSGAQASYAKIAAARALSIPVVMIAPPLPPPSNHTANRIAAAQSFIKTFLKLTP